MNNTELNSKAANGVAWSSVQVWSGRGISLVVFVILSRLLTPEMFGLVAMASVFIFFVQVFQDQGFGDAIVQLGELHADHLNMAFWTNLFAGALLTLIGITAAGLVGDLFHEPRLPPIIRYLSLGFLFGGLSNTQQAILRRQLDFRQLAIRSLIASTTGGMIGILMAFLGFGVWSIVAQSLTSSAAGVLVLWRVTPWRPAFRFSQSHFKELLDFGLNIVGINFLNFLNRHADDMLIGYFLGPTMLGFYTVAYRLFVMMMDLLVGIINNVAFPMFSRLQSDPEQLRRIFYRAVHYTSLFSFPTFIGVAILSPEIIIGLLGSKWVPSIPILQILMFIAILHSIFYLNNSLILSLGKPRCRLGIVFLNAISNVIVFALVVRWGIVAVAAAYVIRGYLLAPLEIYQIRKWAEIDIRYYLKQMTGSLKGSLAMTAVILAERFVLHETLTIPLQLAIYALSGAVTYSAIIQLIEPSSWRHLATHFREKVEVPAIE